MGRKILRPHAATAAVLAAGLMAAAIATSMPASATENITALAAADRTVLAQLSITTPFGRIKIPGPSKPKRRHESHPPSEQSNSAPAEGQPADTVATPEPPAEMQTAVPAATPNVTPAGSPLATFQDCDACPKMATIPPGRFLMGASSADRKFADSYSLASELPQHAVDITYSFAIGVYELTVREYAAYVAETGATTTGDCQLRLPDRGPNRGRFIGTRKGASQTPGLVTISDGDFRRPGVAVSDQHPATCISRREARRYLEWLSRKTGKKYRFPTEAEWEYASRAGTTTTYPGGNDPRQLCKYANFADRASPYGASAAAPCAEQPSPEGTAPVGSYAPNGWGLYDMFGNVFQYVEDCRFPNYKGAPTDGSPWWVNGNENACSTGFVVRSYFFDSIHSNMRAAARCLAGNTWDERSNMVGIRVAVSLDEKAWDRR